MKLTQLRCFTAIARHGLNLTRAADHLHATQPGVSRLIHQLEEELGAELFVRQRNRFVGLSDAGECLLPIALRAVDAAEEMVRTARSLSATQAQVLAIAASPTPARCFLPPIVQRFSHRYPQTRLRILEGNSSHSIDCLSRGEADLCLSSPPLVPSAKLRFSPCYELHWLLLTPRDHPLASLSALTLAHIAGYPVITYEEGFASRAMITDAFRAEGVQPSIALEALDADIMRRYVSSGLGVALVAVADPADVDDAGLCTRDLDGLIRPIGIHVGVRSDVLPSEQSVYLLSIMQEAAQDCRRPR